MADGLTQNLPVDEGSAGRGGIAEGRPRAAAGDPRWIVRNSTITEGDTGLLF